MFAFDDVVVERDGARILDGLTATIGADGVTVLAGPSGSGKSTLLRLCNRLEVPRSGRVRFRGDDLAVLDPLVLRRRVGMVFQRPTLFPGTVRDNLAVALGTGDGPIAEARRRSPRWRPSLDDQLQIDRIGRACLARAGLEGRFLDRTGDTLSGGEAQRVCLARTLLTGPEVLLADEPTSSLDTGAARALEALARELAAEGTPVIWVTHDQDQADRIADDRLVLTGGRVATVVRDRDVSEGTHG